MGLNNNFVKNVEIILTKSYNSLKTSDIYLKEIIKFLGDRNPYKINMGDIQLYLNNFENSSRSKQSQVIAALRFLYIKILKPL